MEKLLKPNLVISKCLGFDSCRYNGHMSKNAFVDSLKPYVNFITVCPEVAIGLGTPRNPVRIANVDNELRLYQPKTEMDFTSEMIGFTNSFLDSIKDIDGFVLKSGSPSCGLKGVKIYNGAKNATSVSKGSGFFGAAAMQKYPYTVIEDDGRLTNLRIRDNFLIKIYTFCDFREVRGTNSIHELVKFHSRNKLLLMKYSQKYLKILGKIVSNSDKSPIEKILEEYQQNLELAFSKIPRYTNNINVLNHAMGYFSKNISAAEREYLLDALEKYRLGKLHLNTPVSLIRAYAIRFEEKYLLEQTFFDAYPEDLISLSDSSKQQMA